jgi:hypothetical protein
VVYVGGEVRRLPRRCLTSIDIVRQILSDRPSTLQMTYLRQPPTGHQTGHQTEQPRDGAAVALAGTRCTCLTLPRAEVVVHGTIHTRAQAQSELPPFPFVPPPRHRPPGLKFGTNFISGMV